MCHPGGAGLGRSPTYLVEGGDEMTTCLAGGGGGSWGWVNYLLGYGEMGQVAHT